MGSKNNKPENQQTVEMVLSRVKRPKKAVITAGMPYANGPLHLGHLAGAHVPADVCARYNKMLIGEENVVFVCGTDDHGSTSEVAALKKGESIHDFIDSIHAMQRETLENYSIGLDIYTGTSSPGTFETHKDMCQDFLKKLKKNNLLEKKESLQWFDTKLERFLPDRYVSGTCPNEKCSNTKAYSNECDECGAQYTSDKLKTPKSELSDCTPILKKTSHLWLDMWKVSDVLLEWVKSKKRTWRKAVYNEIINTVMPCIWFDKKYEEAFKEVKGSLPKHKSRYAPGKRMVAQFESFADLDAGKSLLKDKGIPSEYVDEWAHRSITRDVTWGIPIPKEVDDKMEGKTLYVWPDSLIAPISFTKLALESKGLGSEEYKKYWNDPDARIFQFLGQDNVFFYVLMQGALWVGSQKDPSRMPIEGETQLTDVFGCYHLQINGTKMSKSKGNFYTGDELLKEKSYHPDQIRYHLSLLSLAEKSSNFDFDNFEERNAFLAGPLNAAFEKPQSAAHKKFGGVVPEGKLLEKAESETYKIVQRYVKAMERADYSSLLFAMENYARQINSLFAQYKPQDDRAPEEGRRDALYSCFYILKNLLIMYTPFVPQTMEKLRVSLNLPKSVLKIDELGKPMKADHKLGEMTEYFPPVSS